MAAQERHILVQVNGLQPAYSATVFTPSTGWQEGPGGKTSRLITTDRIGRFNPATLGRSPTKHSRVRVYCDGPVVIGDTVMVLSSDIATESSPQSVTRTPAIPIGTSLETAAVLELGPTDDLGITFAGNNVTATIHIVIYDLSEEEIERRDNAYFAAVVSGLLPQFNSRVLVADGATSITQWQGTLYVAASAVADGQSLPLTSQANVAIGAKVIVYRDDTPAGANARPFNVTAAGTEKINGMMGGSVRMAVNQMGVEFERTSLGWGCIGVADAPGLVTLAGSQVLTPWTERMRTIAWNPNAAPSTLTLPGMARMSVGQSAFVYATAAAAAPGRGFIQPATGEMLNGIVDNAGDVGVVNAGDVVLITRVPGGYVGVELTQNMDRMFAAVALDPAWTVGWKGLRVIQYNPGAAINSTLPPPAACRIGMQLLAHNPTANTVTLVGNGATIAAAGTSAATKALTQNVPMLLTYSGSTIGWLGV